MMMSMTRRCLLALFVCSISPVFAAQETGFLNRSVVVDGTPYRYVVYVPSDYSVDKKWPVILFLHGAGERNDDGLAQTQVGLGGAIRSHVDRFPAVVVMPQCRKGVWWSEPKMEAQVLAALDAEMKEFNGDSDRVYLTGLSMGGYGTWSFAAKYPDKFAALAPVCGGIRIPSRPNLPPQKLDSDVDPYAEAAKKIGDKTPTWIFHGGADPVVPVAESRSMNDALKAVGNPVKYTEYEGILHNSWDKAYNEPDFPTWLLAQRLSARMK
jgi:predicted peptidase